MSLERVAQGISSPLYATAPAGDSSRLFVVEKVSGQIKILNLGTGAVNSIPFITITDISTNSERGLLGLVFHPSYASNGFFYVNLTNESGNTEIRRYQVSSNPNIANLNSEELIIGYDQPFTNHNGGWMGFGPDGYLYIANGDGGSSNDPGNRAQDLHSLLGKMLRLDVSSDDFPTDPTRNYGIPADNPFKGVMVDSELVREEIWAFGLRNPWRSSFDRQTGDLLIADVGQGAREEVNFQAAGSDGGENYGWRLREGLIENPDSVAGGPKPAGNVDPIYDYERGFGLFQGNSVTGGYVYRGPVLAARGHYFFGDFVSGGIWSLRAASGSATQLTDRTGQLVPDAGNVDNIASFGEDALGNLYIIDFDGEIFKLVGDTSAGEGNGNSNAENENFKGVAAVFLLLDE